MKPRSFGSVIACLIMVLLSVQLGCATSGEGLAELHENALVWDTHNDLAYRVLY